MKQLNKLLLIFVILISIIGLSGIVSADNSKLNIEKVEVYKDGNKILGTSGNSGSINVDPGDEIILKVKLENTYSSTTDNHIEDVDVEAIIFDIDDGDDEEDSDDIDVRADRTKTVTLKLNIPDDASAYETYDLDITAEGYDQNGTEHHDSITIEVEVERKTHELVVEEFRIVNIDCNGDADLRLELENAGEEEEEDVEIVVESMQLGTVWRDTVDIPGVGDDDDHYYATSRRIDVAGLSSGEQRFDLEIRYNNERLTVDDSVYVHMPSCGTTSQVTGGAVEDVKSSNRISSEEKWEKEYQELAARRAQLEVVVQDNTLVEPQTVSNNVVKPADNDSEGLLSTIALVLANIVVIIFIMLLARAWYYQ